ncbi:MAG: hypothetical protein ACTS2F_07830 [Thainema sp.]
MNPISININLPHDQQRQLPTSSPVVAAQPLVRQSQPVQAELVEEPHEQVGVFTVPQSGINWDAVRAAIAATCFFVALLLLIQALKPKQQEPTLTQSEVDALLQQERAKWTAEQQALEYERLNSEYQGFKDGVMYGQP